MSAPEDDDLPREVRIRVMRTDGKWCEARFVQSDKLRALIDAPNIGPFLRSLMRDPLNRHEGYCPMCGQSGVEMGHRCPHGVECTTRGACLACREGLAERLSTNAKTPETRAFWTMVGKVAKR